MRDRADRWDYALAGALGALTVLSRLPYRARMLYNWDAVQFALALREYDVVKHQPHPPGYILYVALGRLVNAWLHDETAAYVLLAVAFSGLTTVVVYLLARDVYGRATALAAASVLAVSPLFWFYGSVGLTYAGEALFASGVAYSAFRALDGSEADAWLSAAYLALAAGMRQSLLLLLLPMWLLACALGVRRARTIPIGLVVLGAITLAWFVPMIALTGGLARYIAASAYLADLVVLPTTVVLSPFDTTLRMSRYLLESVLVGLGPLALAALLLPWYVRRHGWGRREWLLLAWIVPPVLVYTLVHFGQAGYVLTFLPALVVLLARVLICALAEAARLARRRALGPALAAAAVVLIVLVNGAFFVHARPLPRDFDTPKPAWRQTAEDDIFDWVFSRTAAALREHEAVVRTFVDGIRRRYPPEETVIITELGNARSYPWLRHAMFYLPEYSMFELRVGDRPPGYYAPQLSSDIVPVRDSYVRLPARTRRLVWFVDHWAPSTARPQGLVEIELPYGRFLYTVPVDRRPIAYAGYTLVRDR
jgi:Dolichyl-phosphate-mannose-protein mannosyltransferase